MRPKIVITHWVHPEIIAYLGSAGEVITNRTKETLPREEVLDRARDASAVMVFMPDIIDRAFVEECVNLKIVAGAFKGYDNVDVKTCTRRGVWFTVAPDLLTIPTAELAVGLLISLGRNIAPGDRFVRSGEFTGWRPLLYGMGLHGRTAGIVGMGRIGHAIADRLAAFGMKLLYCDTMIQASEQEAPMGPARVELNYLLAESDYVILCLPLTAPSFHMINRKSLARMKEGSYLVNVGRGSVVDETAVHEAIDQGRLAGYAADVFEMEDLSRTHKPSGIPQGLLDCNAKTVFTPHLGSAVDDIRHMIALESATAIIEALAGRTPRGALNTPSARKR